MRKVLLALLVAVLMVGMVSCSMDEYARIGEIMGKLGNNVHGITANMTKVDEASNKVSDSVKKDEGGNISVDLEAAAGIISDISEIKNSAQKTEALKQQMQEPACNNAEDAEKLQAALQTKMTDVKNSIPKEGDAGYDEIPASVKVVLSSVSGTLSGISDNIGSNPTKADLAAVAIVNQLADMAKDATTMDPEDTEKLLEMADKAFASVDALKVVSGVSDIDLIGDLDLGSLLSSKAVSKEGEDSKKVVQMMLPTIVKILGMISNDGEFDKAKYDSFVLQSKAIVASYDMGAWASHSFTPSTSKDNWFENLDDLLKGAQEGTQRLSINDLTLYMVCYSFYMLDDVIGGSDEFMVFMNKIVKDNKDIATTGEFNKTALDKELKAAVVKARETKSGLMTNYVIPRMPAAANTIGVILLESGFLDVASLLKSELKEGETVGMYLTRFISEAIESLVPEKV